MQRSAIEMLLKTYFKTETDKRVLHFEGRAFCAEDLL